MVVISTESVGELGLSSAGRSRVGRLRFVHSVIFFQLVFLVVVRLFLPSRMPRRMVFEIALCCSQTRRACVVSPLTTRSVAFQQGDPLAVSRNYLLVLCSV